MLDLKAIRADPDAARAALARRGADEALDRVLELDARRRALLPELEELRAAKNAASKRIGELQREGGDASEAIAEVRSAGDREKELDAELKAVEEELDALLADAAEPARPRGRAGGHGPARGRRGGQGRAATTSSCSAAWSTWRPARAWPARASPTSRARSCCSSWRWCAGRSSGWASKGFEPVIPPVLVREEALYGTGMLPDTEQQIYRVPDDDLYLAGTSEVPLASLHAGEILEELPLRYAGFSPCFRREAGAAGKDTRGIFRVHQFDKVEMFSFVAPGGVRRRARAPARDRGGADAGARSCPTGW